MRLVITTPPVRLISGRYSGGDGPERRVVATVHAPRPREGAGFVADIRCPAFVVRDGKANINGTDEAQCLELAIGGILAWYEHHGVRDIVIETVEPDEAENARESAVHIVINRPPVRWISGWYSDGDGPAHRVVSTVHAPKRVAEFEWAADIRCPRFVISSGMTRIFCVGSAQGMQLATRFMLNMYEHHGVRDIVIDMEAPDYPA